MAYAVHLAHAAIAERPGNLVIPNAGSGRPCHLSSYTARPVTRSWNLQCRPNLRERSIREPAAS